MKTSSKIKLNNDSFAHYEKLKEIVFDIIAMTFCKEIVLDRAIYLFEQQTKKKERHLKAISTALSQVITFNNKEKTFFQTVAY